MDWRRAASDVDRARLTPRWDRLAPATLCRLIIERLYAMAGRLNDRGQSICYGTVGGAVVTGNDRRAWQAGERFGFETPVRTR
ncbi:MAG: hypothetical protein RLO50_08525 [Azospirillaceae bacterium]